MANGKVVPAGDGPTTSEILAVENCIRSPGAVLIRKSALGEVGPWRSLAGWDRRLGHVLSDLTSWCTGVHPTHAVYFSSANRIPIQPRLDDAETRPAHEAQMVEAWRGCPTTDIGCCRADLRLIAKRQWSDLRRVVACRRWREALRMIPLTAVCLAKAVPGVADAILLSVA